MWTQIMQHSDPLLKLKGSKFRKNIYLDEKERQIFYIYGEDIVREHARKIVTDLLAEPVVELDEGHQTPARGHPIFKAMHATGTCCRKCLFSWHRIPKYRALEMHEIDFIVGMLMTWMNSNMVS